MLVAESIFVFKICGVPSKFLFLFTKTLRPNKSPLDLKVMFPFSNFTFTSALSLVPRFLPTGNTFINPTVNFKISEASFTVTPATPSTFATFILHVVVFQKV
jgi:hypothetical protein